MENNWKLHHVGVVVRDLDKTVKYFQSIGANTSQPERIHPVSKNKIRNIQLGSLTLELIQPAEGKTPARDFSNKRGQGMFHIGFTIEDFDEEKVKMLETGASIVLSAQRPEGDLAYFEPPEAGCNVIMELMEQRQ